jgi:CBS domain-containing protein
MPAHDRLQETVMLAREAMSPGVVLISANQFLVEAARCMRDYGIGCLPVGQINRLTGMVTDRDIVCKATAAGRDPRVVAVYEVMTNGITSCFEDETIDDVVQRMDSNEIHHIPVLNRQNQMVGMLTLSDLAHRGPQHFAGSLSHHISRDARRRETTHPPPR